MDTAGKDAHSFRQEVRRNGSRGAKILRSIVSISTGGGSGTEQCRPADTTREPTTGMKRKAREAEVEGEQKGREDSEGATEPRLERRERLSPGEKRWHREKSRNKEKLRRWSKDRRVQRTPRISWKSSTRERDVNMSVTVILAREVSVLFHAISTQYTKNSLYHIISSTDVDTTFTRMTHETSKRQIIMHRPTPTKPSKSIQLPSPSPRVPTPLTIHFPTRLQRFMNTTKESTAPSTH
jgi:hypothetical protein